jgi:hypothetical protein
MAKFIYENGVYRETTRKEEEALFGHMENQDIPKTPKERIAELEAKFAALEAETAALKTTVSKLDTVKAN